jgi:hypothetical protein
VSGNGKPPKPPKGGPGDKKKPFRVVKQSEPVSAKPSPDQIRQLYMASKFVEWTPFAESMGWPTLDSRHGLPIGDWIKAKRDIIAREQAERVAEAVFSHRSRWHGDVLKTLKEYPEANDAMLGLLKRRLNDLIRMVNDDEKGQALSMQTGQGYESKFAKIKTGDLMALAAAIKVCTESKHRSLLIDNWSFKVAETFSDPRQFGTTEEKIADMEWKVELIGGENLTQGQMQDFLGRYYDRPVLPHAPDQVAPPKASGGED